jgi:uncharacterized protein (TIGR03067 family)
MLRFASTVIVCLLASAILLAAEKDRKLGGEEAKLLEGTWRLVKGEIHGAALPTDEKHPITLEISGDHYKLTAESPDEGSVRLFPDKSPKAMDIMGTKGPNKGKTFPAIYELKGDELKVCYDLSGKERPKTFESSSENQHFLAIYERVKR